MKTCQKVVLGILIILFLCTFNIPILHSNLISQLQFQYFKQTKDLEKLQNNKIYTMSTARIFASPPAFPAVRAPVNARSPMPQRNPHPQSQQQFDLNLPAMRMRLQNLVKQAQSILPPDPQQPRPKNSLETKNKTESREVGRRESASSMFLPFHLEKPLPNGYNPNPKTEDKLKSGQTDGPNSTITFQRRPHHKRQSSLKQIRTITQPQADDPKFRTNQKENSFRKQTNPERSESGTTMANENIILRFSEKEPAKEQIIYSYEKDQMKKQKEVEPKEPEISWTKYLLLQFKNEELQEQLKKIKDQLDRSRERNLQLRQQMQKKEKEAQENINNLAQHYTQKLDNQKMQYEKQLKEKNQHIRDLVNKYSQMSQIEKEASLQKYVDGLFEENKQMVIQIQRVKQANKEQQSKHKALVESVEYYKHEIQSIQEQLQASERQLEKIQQLLASKKTPFEEIIKVQMEEQKKAKERENLLREENRRLKQSMKDHDSEINRMISDQSTIQLREKALRNKMVTEMGIAMGNKDNQIQHLTRKLQTLESKYKMTVEEIKAKDDFLQHHLVGRTDQLDVKQYILEVLKKYEKRFQIENDEEKYLQEIESLKKKLSLFERDW